MYDIPDPQRHVVVRWSERAHGKTWVTYFKTPLEAADALNVSVDRLHEYYATQFPWQSNHTIYSVWDAQLHTYRPCVEYTKKWVYMHVEWSTGGPVYKTRTALIAKRKRRHIVWRENGISQGRHRRLAAIASENVLFHGRSKRWSLTQYWAKWDDACGPRKNQRSWKKHRSHQYKN